MINESNQQKNVLYIVFLSAVIQKNHIWRITFRLKYSSRFSLFSAVKKKITCKCVISDSKIKRSHIVVAIWPWTFVCIQGMNLYHYTCFVTPYLPSNVLPNCNVDWIIIKTWSDRANWLVCLVLSKNSSNL